MKKTKLIVLASSVLAAALLAGCSNSAKDNADSPARTRDVQATDTAAAATISPEIDETDDVEETSSPSENTGEGRPETADVTVEIEGQEVTMPVTLEEGSFTAGPWFNIYMDSKAYTPSKENGIYKYSVGEDTPGHAYLELQFVSDVNSDEYSEIYKENYSDAKLEEKGETKLNDNISAKLFQGSSEETGSVWTTYAIDTNNGVLTLVISTSAEDADGNGARLLALAETLEIL